MDGRGDGKRLLVGTAIRESNGKISVQCFSIITYQDISDRSIACISWYRMFKMLTSLSMTGRKQKALLLWLDLRNGHEGH